MEILGDLMPENLLEKVGYVPSNGKMQGETRNDNFVYVKLLANEETDPFYAFDKKFVDEHGMDKRSALVAIQEKLAIKGDLNLPKVPRKVLLDNGWSSETGVLSHYNSDKGSMAKYAQFFIVNDKWRFNNRYEIFGPCVEGKGVIELQPGVYYLNLPGSELGKSALEFGVSVEETNKGKNAFRHPRIKKERESLIWWDEGRFHEPTDKVLIEQIGGKDYARGMKLFFRKHPTGPRPLYLMRPCKAGVIDFVNLHPEVSFNEENGTITVPKDHFGYWVGEKGNFIKWLSELYGEKLKVEEYSPRKNQKEIK